MKTLGVLLAIPQAETRRLEKRKTGGQPVVHDRAGALRALLGLRLPGRRAGLRRGEPRGVRRRGERPAGRAELLAKKGHTGRVQNPVKVSENRPACGTAQHTLAVCFVFEKLEKS